ncbi:MAG: acylphosphatase [Archaeoglobaceae archaeon]
MQGIKGYAENLSTNEVIVVAEGESKKVEDLIKTIEKDAPT